MCGAPLERAKCLAADGRESFLKCTRAPVDWRSLDALRRMGIDYPSPHLAALMFARGGEGPASYEAQGAYAYPS